MNIFRFIWISNIVLEPYLKLHLYNVFSKSNVTIQITQVPYEEIESYCDEIKSANCVAIHLDYNNMYCATMNTTDSFLETENHLEEVFNQCRLLYNHLKRSSAAQLIWIGFEDYCFDDHYLWGSIPVQNNIVDELNSLIFKMIKSDVYISLKRLIAQNGIANSYNINNKYRWNAPYSDKLIFLIAQEIHKQYMISKGNTKKCVVLDCDNVLWGGILSEDGIEGIHIDNAGLGRPYQDFQRFLLKLYIHGVILTVCSKNDEKDVLQVFREHSGMLLKEEHIACFMVNWQSKPENIKQISKTLNIGLDSMVFIDDMDYEIGSVKDALPTVTTILYNRNTIYRDLSCFNLKKEIFFDNVQQRTQTYQTNRIREKLKETCSEIEYLEALESKVNIHPASSSEIARISELTLRTNKCSNGTRYTVNQLKQLLSNNNYSLYSITLSDKFSNLGLVGALGMTCEGVLDLFSLSCRALGRNIEQQMLEYAQQCGMNKAVILPTGKNQNLCKKLSDIFDSTSI